MYNVKLILLLSEKMKNKGMIDQNTNGQSEELELPFFNLAITAIATNKFSSNNKLGEGGFGLVYKVTLINQFASYSASIKSICKCEFLGYTSRWTRNCCEKAFTKF